MNNKIMTLKDTKNNNRIGGGIFFNSDKSSKKHNFVDLLKKSISSESKLINQLKKYKELVNDYDKIYKEHTSNLDKMDGYLEDDNFNSFVGFNIGAILAFANWAFSLGVNESLSFIALGS